MELIVRVSTMTLKFLVVTMQKMFQDGRLPNTKSGFLVDRQTADFKDGAQCSTFIRRDILHNTTQALSSHPIDGGTYLLRTDDSEHIRRPQMFDSVIERYAWMGT